MRWLHFGTAWGYRVLSWVVVVAGIMFAAAILALRYWLLPDIDSHRETIAQRIAQATNLRVTIGSIEGNWDGIQPYLVLSQVVFHDRENRVALDLERVDATLSWWSLYTLGLRFQSIDIRRPTLAVRRDVDGRIYVGGNPVDLAGGDGGLGDWLLRQRTIAVSDATITWHDEQRAAPPLELSQVGLRIENRGRHHRFGLRASPPSALAAPIDIRGDLSGDTFAEIAEWNGQLFLQVDYANVAAWRRWVDLPLRLPSGEGALRLWLGLDRGALTSVVADLELARVRARLAPDLEEIDLERLRGRVGWRSLPDGFEFSSSKLALATTDGLTLAPADVLFRLQGKPDDPASERGELHANALDLEPIGALIDRLPVGKAVHDELEKFWPTGSVYDVVAKWRGEWPQAASYSLKGRFVNLSVKAAGRIPGFSGATGHIDGTERGGTLYLNSQAATAELPRVLPEPLQLKELTAQVAWSRAGGEWEIKLNNLAVGNEDVSGVLFGTYRTDAASRGTIDLTGSFQRADPSRLGRYLPADIGEGRHWINTSFPAGEAYDIKLRLKGRLDDFPYADGKSGVFQVTGHARGLVLDYADGWPKIENLEGDFTFRGTRLEVTGRGASIYGVRFARMRAEIPDLGVERRIARITGEAEGPTSDFLRFIENSPVYGMIDQFTEGMRATGNGKLGLRMDIPLGDTARTRLAGTFVMANNRLELDPDLPPFEQVNARLEFTESAVRMPSATFIALGGPASATAVTEKGGTVRVSLQGRASFDSFAASSTDPLVHAMRGAADWRGTVTLRGRQPDLVFESSLQGVTLDLPPPLTKGPNDPLPLRIERQVTTGKGDRYVATLGTVAAVDAHRRLVNGRYLIDRANVVFGGPAPAPERPGIWVSGQAPSLNFDRWAALLAKSTVDTSGAPAGEVAAVNLQVGLVQIFGREFHDCSLNMVRQKDQWQGNVVARELTGTVVWRPEGRGAVTARLKDFTLPASLISTLAPAAPAAGGYQPRELPALDIVADNFTFRDKALGRLELNAVPDGREWRIEKLRVSNPDGVLALDGLWQTSLTPSRTQLNARLDVMDIGRFLTRLGYPEAVRRGTAKIEGPVSWNGVPWEIDFPSLSGNLIVEAAKGQFVKLDPGAGKLLGVLSLQSIPRRLSLDFRDIFTEGYAFDEITASVRITRGVARTEGLRIGGPSARIVMTGEVDIAQETQNLRVRVTPYISDTLSVAGAFVAGPVAGVAAFLVQKLLRDPINELASFEYRITGTWADPLVTKVEGPEAPAAKPAPPAEKGK